MRAFFRSRRRQQIEQALPTLRYRRDFYSRQYTARKDATYPEVDYLNFLMGKRDAYREAVSLLESLLTEQP